MCRAKNFWSVALSVISQAVALAPFSQNSAGCGMAGLAQAQLTHMKPLGLFCSSSTRAPFAGMRSRRRISDTDLSDP